MVRTMWCWFAAICLLVPGGAGASEEALAAEVVAPSGAVMVARARAITRLSQELVTGIEFQGVTQEIKGRMWKDGPRVRFEMVLPTKVGELKQYAVFDGRVFTTYLPAPANISQKIDFSEVQRRVSPRKWALFNRARALAVESDPFLGVDLNTLAFMRSETLEGESVQVFSATMEPLPDDFRSAFPYVAAQAELWVATSDGLPRRVIHLTDAGATIVMHTFRHVEIKAEMDDSLFTLDVPLDAKVEDTTRQIVLKLED